MSSPSKLTHFIIRTVPRNYKMCSLQYYHFILKKTAWCSRVRQQKTTYIFTTLTPHPRYFSYIQQRKLQKNFKNHEKTLKKDHYHPQTKFQKCFNDMSLVMQVTIFNPRHFYFFILVITIRYTQWATLAISKVSLFPERVAN